MTARQARSARASLGLSAKQLADKTGVSHSSVRRIEEGLATLDLRAKVQNWYERNGIMFWFNDGGRGVSWVEK